jgi:hypothetical protein
MPEEDLVLSECGFHCCAHPLDCLVSYTAYPSNHYVEVKMLGKILTSSPDDPEPKCATNILKIEREIPYEEWLELCTVTVSRWSPGYYIENHWVKGKLLERRVFYSNGNRKVIVTFLKPTMYCGYTTLLKSILYFQNGMEHFVQARSELCSHNDAIMIHESGKAKMTQVWVQKEWSLECIRTMKEWSLECIRTMYDEQGNKSDEGFSEIIEEEVRSEKDFLFRLIQM